MDIFTIESEQEVVCGLSNGTISSNHTQPPHFVALPVFGTQKVETSTLVYQLTMTSLSDVT